MAEIAGKYDFSIRAGNTGTTSNESGLVFTFLNDDDTEQDLTGFTYAFKTAIRGGVEISKTNDIVVLGGKVTIPFDLADSRALPVGANVHYELERRTATTQVTVMEGILSIIAGTNDD